MRAPLATTRTRQPPSRSNRKHGAKKPTSAKRGPGFFRRFWWLWAPPLGFLLGAFLILAIVYSQLRLPNPDPQALTTRLYDVDGRLVATLHAGENRVAIPLQRMPEHLREAVLAAEDAGFYRHGGISFTGILRAAWANVTNREITQGGSTITQQYVRNAFSAVGTERSYTRKVKEILLSLKLEQKLSKNQILERYLNTIYLGHGAYGVQAAARTYFGVSADELSLSQSATLAGVISAPEYYEPSKFPERATERRDWVLARMVQLGMILPDEAEEAATEPVETVARPAEVRAGRAPYFVDYTKRYLERRFGVQTTFTGGLRVRTSLDLDHQRAAEEAIATHLGEAGDPSVALVSMRVDTGEITAMVGGRNFAKAQYNLATGDGTPGRQAGSAFKTFTLTAAVQDGISLKSRFEGPSEIDIDDPRCGDWSPGNYSDSGVGTMDLVRATANSVNTIFAQLVVKVGPDRVGRTARSMGIRSPLGDPVPCSITLGTKEVTPLEMTNAYATLASLGVRHKPTPVHVVRGPDGVLERVNEEGVPVMDENTAAQVIYALKQVVCCGTGTAANFGVPIFGKTGTTDDHADAWFCGASAVYAACVWVGYPSGRVPMEDVHGISVTGGSFPALIWHDFMAVIHAGLEVPDFPEPDFTGEVINAAPSPSPSPSPSPPPKKKPTPTPTPTPSVSPLPTPTTSPGEGGEG
jgi:penicillin-binding protein 1A